MTSEAMPRKKTKPITSVMAVTKMLAASAGSVTRFLFRLERAFYARLTTLTNRGKSRHVTTLMNELDHSPGAKSLVPIEN